MDIAGGTTKAAPLPIGAAGRLVAVIVTGVLLVFVAILTGAVYVGAVARGEVGFDADLYARIGSHFLATGEAYYPVQSATYEAAGTVNLYPPTALYLFVPASFTPRILWWLVPLGIIAWSLYRLRPAWWSWPLMAAACLYPLNAPEVPVGLVYGNTLMWTLAAMLAGAAFRPGIAWAVLIKPTHILWALPWAVRSWRGLAVMVAVSVVLLPLWFDWFEAIGNLNPKGPLLMVSPTLAIPLVAWVARR